VDAPKPQLGLFISPSTRVYGRYIKLADGVKLNQLKPCGHQTWLAGKKNMNIIEHPPFIAQFPLKTSIFVGGNNPAMVPSKPKNLVEVSPSLRLVQKLVWKMMISE